MVINQLMVDIEAINYKIHKFETEIEELCSLCGLPRKFSGGERVNTSGHSAPQEKFVLKLEELEEQVKILKDERQVIGDNLMLVIGDKVNLFEKRLIEERLINSKPWNEVTTWQGFSQGHIRRIYREAVTKLLTEDREYGI